MAGSLPSLAALQSISTKDDNADKLVAKRSRWLTEEYDSKRAYMDQMEVQSVSAFMARQFNKATEGKVTSSRVLCYVRFSLLEALKSILFNFDHHSICNVTGPRIADFSATSLPRGYVSLPIV
jgi:hypothetical protein